MLLQNIPAVAGHASGALPRVELRVQGRHVYQVPHRGPPARRGVQPSEDGESMEFCKSARDSRRQGLLLAATHPWGQFHGCSSPSSCLTIWTQ